MSQQWVITSGQCASKYFDLTVRAGSNYTTEGGEVYQVGKIVIHPQFNKETLDSDLALLKLTENVTIDHAWNINLPLANQSTDTRPFSWVYLTGWGYTQDSPNSISEEMQFAEVKANSLSDCRKKYVGKILTENMWCGSYANIAITSCYGDFGGPANLDARLFGIQSWGGGCGDVDHPSIFTTVSHFVPWIEQMIKT